MSKFLIFEKYEEDEENLHHNGVMELQVTTCSIIIALLCVGLFFAFTPKTATIVSVVFVLGVLLKYCFYAKRKERLEAGVVTEQ